MTPIINDIYQVFKDYYREENVDLQQYGNIATLYIYWDTVTIENEYDEHIDIHGLYARLKINLSGQLAGRPNFIRSKYNDAQWQSKYRHSHMESLTPTSALEWSGSCLGSGPIKNTISKLESDNTYYHDTAKWLLFAFELDKYVHTESVSGGPYRRLNSVSASAKDKVIAIYPGPYSYTVLRGTLQREFAIELLHSKCLKFAYSKGQFELGMSDTDAVLAISNLFIDWYNKRLINDADNTSPAQYLYDNSVLEKVVFRDGKLYSCRTRDSHTMPPLVTMINSSLRFSFKGRTVTLSKIGESASSESRSITILSTTIINNLIYKILRFVNTTYGKEIDFSKRTRII